jgi:hypothetical protein
VFLYFGILRRIRDRAASKKVPAARVATAICQRLRGCARSLNPENPASLNQRSHSLSAKEVRINTERGRKYPEFKRILLGHGVQKHLLSTWADAEEGAASYQVVELYIGDDKWPLVSVPA